MKTNRYQTDNSGHVWIKPTGDQGRAREFRWLNDQVQERITDDHSVIKWVFIKHAKGQRVTCKRPGDLLSIVENWHRKSQPMTAMAQAYLEASRGQ